MKKMVLGIVGFVVLSAQMLMAAVTVNVLAAFEPVSDGYYAAYKTNAVSVYLGGVSSGLGTPAWYQSVTSGDINQMIDTSGKFNFWNGIINPSGSYSSEFGSTLVFGAVIDGGGSGVSLSEISYSVFDGRFSTTNSGSFLSKNYGPSLIGVDSDGLGGLIFATSGSGTNIHEKIIVLNYFSYSYVVSGIGTPQEQLGLILDGKDPFLFNAAFTYDADGLNISDTEIVNVIPEPAIMGLVAIGGVLILVKRRFYARI